MNKQDFTVYTGYNPKLQANAKQLRTNMTHEEQLLWFNHLRQHSVKFYRQRPIAYYIADFYCSKAGLVIELDGSQHFTEEGKTYDDFRTEIIEHFGLEAIRFTNREIRQQFDAVCRMIDHRVQTRMHERMMKSSEHESAALYRPEKKGRSHHVHA